MEKQQFCDHARALDDPAVFRLSAELPTEAMPLAAYETLKNAFGSTNYSFLLENAKKVPSTDPDGAFSSSESVFSSRQYSYVGYDPDAVVTLSPDTSDLTVLDERYEDLLEIGDGDVLDGVRGCLPDFDRRFESQQSPYEGGLVGFLAYDAVYDLWLDERDVEHPDSDTPDAQFVLNTKTLVFDHQAETVRLVFTPVVTPDDDAAQRYEEFAEEAERVADLLSDPSPADPDGFVLDSEEAGPRDEYRDAVEQTKRHVRDGDIYQGVISRKRKLTGDLDVLGLYQGLHEEYHSTYMYLLEYGDRSIVGASPETLVAVHDDQILSNPLAGTCARGTSPIEDRKNAGNLLADEKECAEHVMLVDLARNDIRRVSTPGSVSVDSFMSVIKHANVQHIESVVTGDLADDADGFDTVRAAFPVGTLSGAPKIRAMEIIDEIENEPRGIYGGGVGYFSWGGETDLAIAIRMATIDHHEQDHVTVQAGAGIVADSDPDSEYEETEQKMSSVTSTLESIEVDETRPQRTTSQNVVADDMQVLFVDNFDSFTYNLVEYVSEHAETQVVRNTASLEELSDADPEAIIISPGPGHPRNERDVGVSTDVFRELSPDIPTLGVCLGLEAAVYAYGGSIDHAPEPVHGKASPIDHDGEGVFRDLEQGFFAGRYHSLVSESVPDCFEVSARARTEDLVMGIRHREHPIECVQFHPESVLTGAGHDIINNFLSGVR